MTLLSLIVQTGNNKLDEDMFICDLTRCGLTVAQESSNQRTDSVKSVTQRGFPALATLSYWPHQTKYSCGNKTSYCIELSKKAFYCL